MTASDASTLGRLTRKVGGLRHGAVLCGVALLPLFALAAVIRQEIPPAVDLLQLPAAPTKKGDRKTLLQLARAANHMIAVGEGGLILRSADDGRSWTQASSPVSVMLTAVTMVNAMTGWAVGHDGVILATQDGGVSWRRQFDGRQANEQVLRAAEQRLEELNQRKGDAAALQVLREQAEDRLADAEAAMDAGPSQPLLGVVFTDVKTGFVVGAFGQLFETRDGGEHWTYTGNRLENPEGLHLNMINVMPSGDLYIAAEGGKLFRSVDGGQQWKTIDLGYAGHMYGVIGLTHPHVVLAYGFNGHIYRSVDRGEHWAPVESPAKKAIVDALSVDGRILLLSQDGRVVASSDGGATFKRLGLLPGSNLSSFMLRDGQLLGVGARGVGRIELTELAKEEK